MEHLPTSIEYELMKEIDFIVPLKQVRYILYYIIYYIDSFLIFHNIIRLVL